MKTSKTLFYVNLGFSIFLGIGWIFFYSFIIMDDITRIPRALVANATIAGLNAIFFLSLAMLPFTYRFRRHRDVITK